MIDKIGHYSITNPATVYDEEALTAIELAARTTAKANECVDVVNAVEKRTDEKLAEIPARVKNAAETKVDEYIEDGTFDEAIDEYAGELTDRLNNLVGNFPEGSTTMDAEIIDARLDYKGDTHTNLGNMLRNKLGEFEKRISRINEYQIYTADKSRPRYESNSTTGGCILHIRDDLVLKRKNSDSSTPLEWATHADTLGDKIKFNGDYAAITIPSHTSLVFNVTDMKYYIRGQHGAVRDDDIALFEIGFRYPVGGQLLPIVNFEKTNDTYNLYLGHSSRVVFTEVGTGGAIVTFNDTLAYLTPNHGGHPLEWANYTSNLPDITIDGQNATITIPMYSQLVFNTGDEQFYIRDGRMNVKNTDIVVLDIGFTEPIGGCIMDEITYKRTVDIDKKLVEHITSINKRVARINEYQIYTSDKSRPRYESNSTTGGCILHIRDDLVLKRKNSDSGTPLEWATHADTLGDKITFNGDYAAITIPSHTSLVFNVTDMKYYIRGQHGAVREDDIALFEIGFRYPVGGQLLPIVNFEKTNDTYNLYLGHSNRVVFTEVGTGGAIVTFKGTIGYQCPTGSRSLEWSNYTSNLPDITIDGQNATIKIPIYSQLVFNTGDEQFYIRDGRMNVKNTDVVALDIGFTEPIGGCLLDEIIFKNLNDFKKEVAANGTGGSSSTPTTPTLPTALTNAKVKEFTDKFIGAGANCDAFLFFTDPHFVRWNGNANWIENYHEKMNQIEAIAREVPIDFVLCGGDWLNNSDTPSEAASALGYIDGDCRKRFKNYYHVLGNHDTNYQGVNDAGETNQGRLSQNALNAIWFNNTNTGKAYYTFETKNTLYVVFDSGIDWTFDQTYCEEQIAWFVDVLTNNTKPYIVPIMHIGFDSTPVDGEKAVAYRSPLSDAIEYTYRMYKHKHASPSLTITFTSKLYGKTMINAGAYDFSNVTTLAEIPYVLSGHTHKDLLATLAYSVSTTNFVSRDQTNINGGVSFDLVLNDYDNKKVHFVRIGTGESFTLEY